MRLDALLEKESDIDDLSFGLFLLLCNGSATRLAPCLWGRVMGL